MNPWRDVAELAYEALADQDDVSAAFEAGVRIGRFVGGLLYPLNQEEFFQEGRRSGLADGFEMGLAEAERRRAGAA